MNFAPPRVCCNSGRATPSLRRTQHPATRNKRNPAERLIIREELFRQPEPAQLVALSLPGVRRSWDRPWGGTGDHGNSYLIHDTLPNDFPPSEIGRNNFNPVGFSYRA